MSKRRNTGRNKPKDRRKETARKGRAGAAGLGIHATKVASPRGEGCGGLRDSEFAWVNVGVSN